MLTDYARRLTIALVCLVVVLGAQPALSPTACASTAAQLGYEGVLYGECECCSPQCAAVQQSGDRGVALQAAEPACGCAAAGRGSGDAGAEKPALSSHSEIWGAVVSGVGFRPEGSHSPLLTSRAFARRGMPLLPNGARSPPLT